MADFVFNISKGRIVEFYSRVDNNDPATAGLKIYLLASSGLEADGTLQDYATMHALLAASNNEPTNTGYALITLTDADTNIASPGVDNTNNWWAVDIPDQTWTSVGTFGGAIGKLIICYAPDVSGADTTFIPMTGHDFSITPDGTNITAQINAAGFFKAA